MSLRLAIALIVAITALAVSDILIYRQGYSRGFDRGWDKGFIRGLENPEYRDK